MFRLPQKYIFKQYNNVIELYFILYFSRHTLMNIIKQAIASDSQSTAKRFASSKTIFQPRKPSLFNPRAINQNNNQIFNTRLTPNFNLHYGNQIQSLTKITKTERTLKNNIIKMYSETSGPDPLKIKPMSNTQKQNVSKKETKKLFNSSSEQKTTSKPLKESTFKESISHKKTIKKEPLVRIFFFLIKLKVEHQKGRSDTSGITYEHMHQICAISSLQQRF